MKKETYKYKGWLNSDNFAKRVIAVTAYQMFGSFIVATTILVIFIIPIIIIAGVYRFNFADSSTYHTNSEIDLNKESNSDKTLDENRIYFDKETREWKDNYGICNTCTPENGFSLDGIETESSDYLEDSNQYSDTSTIYNCNGDLIVVKFDNTDINTASLFVKEKNRDVILESVKTGSGTKYSDGDITFWTHQNEAIFSIKSTGSSINCVRNMTEPLAGSTVGS
jgi:membrane-bound inhibitor of C-type lysozyme